MSSFSFGLNGAGIIAGTIGTITGLAGVVGLIVSTPQFCPESLPLERCRVTSRNAAGLAMQGLLTAGVGGLLVAGSRLIDPEA